MLKTNLRVNKSKENLLLPVPLPALLPVLLIPTVLVLVLLLLLMKLEDGKLQSNRLCLNKKQVRSPLMNKVDSPRRLMKMNSTALLMPDFSFNKKSPQDQEKPESITSLFKKLTEKLLSSCSMTTLTGDLTTSEDTFSHKKERSHGITKSSKSDLKLRMLMRLFLSSLRTKLTPK
jgi:hypothetical protein